MFRRQSVRRRRPVQTNPSRRALLLLEALEDRTVPTAAVAILGAEFDPSWIEDVRSKVESTGLFTSVDAVDVVFSTPTVAQLEAYDAVLVWSDSSFADPTALGDNLADFVDDGHGVVVATFTNTFFAPLEGRWASDGYDAIEPSDVTAFTQLTLGDVAQPGHPIMAGVTNFDGGFASWHSIGGLTPGTSLIASWSDGLPLVAEKSNLDIGLNFFPVSSDVYSDGWDSSTQGALLMANALNYVSSFGVSSTVPANGSTVFTHPTQYTVNVNGPVAPGSLDASDFEVNGHPATGVAYTPGTTSITFTFASDPVSTQGLQTMHVTAGAFVSDSDGSPTREFNGTFRYDAVLMAVTSTVPANGSTIILPATTIDLNFNEPYALSSAQVSDFTVNQGSVASVSQVDADTLRLTLSGVTAEGTLTVSMPAGAMTDVYGNAGAAFSASYTLDFSTTPFPTPLKSIAPAGSLIYDGSQVGIVSPGGDSDSFSILVDPGQKITVTVDPAATLRPVVELYRGTALIASATAGSAGLEAVLQTVATQGQLGVMGPGPTTYIVTVRGAGGTTGGYTARMILNAAVESESHDGATNNSRPTAQSLDPAFLSFNASVTSSQSSAFPGSAAVLGTLEAATLGTAIDSDNFESGALDGQWTTYSSRPEGQIRVTGAAGTASGSYALLMDTSDFGVYNLNEAVWTVNLSGQTAAVLKFAHADFSDEEDPLPLNFDGHATGDGVAISNDGVHWHRVLNATNVPFGWNTVVIDLAAEAAAAGMTLGAGFQIKFQQYDNFPIFTDGRAYDDIVVGVPVRAQDFHSFSLKAGESVTLALKGTAGLELQSAAGTTLATASAGPANFDKIISDYVAPTTGTYYARLSSSSFAPSDYTLVVTRNADFDTEGNNSLVTAQAVAGTQVAGRQWAMGYAQGGIDPSPLFALRGTPVTGGLVLTGTKLQLGINADGSFITDDLSAGIQYLGNEFVIPGTPLASFTVASNGTNYTNAAPSGGSAISVTIEDLSSGTLRGARIVGLVGGNLQLERVVLFQQGDEYATIATRLTNVGATPLSNVAWLENLDPDQGEPLGADTGFATYNDVVLGGRLVRATAYPAAYPGGLTIGLGSADSRAVTSAEGFFVTDPYAVINSPEDPNGAVDDIAINTAFDFGGLAAGQSAAGVMLMTFGVTPAAAENLYTAHAGTTQTLNSDFYKVTLGAGKPLEVETTTPAGGDGVFENHFDPLIRVYDAVGHLVASDDNSAPDGRNARVKYNVPSGAGGVYYIEVTASTATPVATAGEYIISIKGNTAGHSQYLEGDPIDGAGAAKPLSDAALKQAVAQAIGYWRSQGVDASALGSINVQAADLVGSMLGHTFDGSIVIDVNAAGHGWSLGSGGPAGTLNLNETVEHEMGHALGFEHTDVNPVMQATLSPNFGSLVTVPMGENILPATRVVQAGQLTGYGAMILAGPTAVLNTTQAARFNDLGVLNFDTDTQRQTAQWSFMFPSLEKREDALTAVMAEWGSAQRYADRVAVQDDGEEDLMTDASGQDSFWASGLDKSTDPKGDEDNG